MDCYIVRIYRRQAGDSSMFAGLLEEVGTQGSRPFSSMEELCGLLGQGRSKKKKEKQAPKHGKREKNAQEAER